MTREGFSIDGGGVALIALLITVCAIALILTWDHAFGEPYQKGNNTIANVTTPIIDLNNEQDYDSPVRLVHPHPEMDFEDIDWDCRLYGECNNETNSERVVAIECPNSFTAATNMTEYYECMGVR